MSMDEAVKQQIEKQGEGCSIAFLGGLIPVVLNSYSTEVLKRTMRYDYGDATEHGVCVYMGELVANMSTHCIGRTLYAVNKRHKGGRYSTHIDRRKIGIILPEYRREVIDNATAAQAAFNKCMEKDHERSSTSR